MKNKLYPPWLQEASNEKKNYYNHNLETDVLIHSKSTMRWPWSKLMHYGLAHISQDSCCTSSHYCTWLMWWAIIHSAVLFPVSKWHHIIHKFQYDAVEPHALVLDCVSSSICCSVNILPHVSKTKSCQNGKSGINFTIMNRLRDPITKTHCVSGITWLQVR
jgi:hypothetical protein